MAYVMSTDARWGLGSADMRLSTSAWVRSAATAVAEVLLPGGGGAVQTVAAAGRRNHQLCPCSMASASWDHPFTAVTMRRA
jgi:hypothetical protein